ncbi:MAG: glyoxylate/hydroxypyruvate reductase A, partial [Paracoccaceae bacterium]
MKTTALYAGNPDHWTTYRQTLAASFARAGIAVNLVQKADDPADVDYIIYAPKADHD